jgi:hypothetical protein
MSGSQNEVASQGFTTLYRHSARRQVSRRPQLRHCERQAPRRITAMLPEHRAQQQGPRLAPALARQREDVVAAPCLVHDGAGSGWYRREGDGGRRACIMIPYCTKGSVQKGCAGCLKREVHRSPTHAPAARKTFAKVTSRVLGDGTDTPGWARNTCTTTAAGVEEGGRGGSLSSGAEQSEEKARERTRIHVPRVGHRDCDGEGITRVYGVRHDGVGRCEGRVGEPLAECEDGGEAAACVQ